MNGVAYHFDMTPKLEYLAVTQFFTRKTITLTKYNASCKKGTAVKHLWIAKWYALIGNGRITIVEITTVKTAINFNSSTDNADCIKKLIITNRNFIADDINMYCTFYMNPDYYRKSQYGRYMQLMAYLW